MSPSQDTAASPASRLHQACELLRGQLAAVARLAVVALGLLQPAGRFGFESADPMKTLGGLEKAIRRQARIAWALRLISALRAKLTGDLQRVERGEDPGFVFAAEAAVRAPTAEAQADTDADIEPAPSPAERAERFAPERDRPERERFERLFSRPADDEFAEILKRPTAEVIALIREALGLAAEADDSERGEGAAIDARSSLRCEAPDHPPPGLRSPRAPPDAPLDLH